MTWEPVATHWTSPMHSTWAAIGRPDESTTVPWTVIEDAGACSATAVATVPVAFVGDAVLLPQAPRARAVSAAGSVHPSRRTMYMHSPSPYSPKRARCEDAPRSRHVASRQRGLDRMY